MAVGPSRAVKRLEPKSFTQRAVACAAWIFGDLPFKVDYSGSDLVRCVVPDPAPDPGTRPEQHRLAVYPNGLVRVDWGLTVSLADRTKVQLSLDEIGEVLARMYRFAHDPTYRALWRARKTERFQRLDWRVGLTSSVVHIEGPIAWTDLVASGRLPATRTEGQLPGSPLAGYAADHLNSTKRST